MNVVLFMISPIWMSFLFTGRMFRVRGLQMGLNNILLLYIKILDKKSPILRKYFFQLVKRHHKDFIDVLQAPSISLLCFTAPSRSRWYKIPGCTFTDICFWSAQVIRTAFCVPEPYGGTNFLPHQSENGFTMLAELSHDRQHFLRRPHVGGRSHLTWGNKSQFWR